MKMQGIFTAEFNTHLEDDGIRPYSSWEFVVLANDNAAEESCFPSWTCDPVFPPCTNGILRVLNLIGVAFHVDGLRGVSEACFRAMPYRAPF